jgi:hypothetical protein
MILFPAIDLKDGQCVRLKLGDMDAGDGVQRRSRRAGEIVRGPGVRVSARCRSRRRLCRQEPINGAAVEAMLKAVSFPVQLGGGIRSIAHIEEWLSKRPRPRHSRHHRGARSLAGARSGEDCFPARWRSASMLAAGRWRWKAGRKPPSSLPSSWRSASKDAGVAAIIYHRYRARRPAQGAQSRCDHRARRSHLDSGDRFRRLCLDRRTSRRCWSRVRTSWPAPSSGSALCMTAGSIPPPR